MPLVEISGISSDSPNKDILKKGDVILSFDGISAPSKVDFLKIVKRVKTKSVPVRVLRENKEIDLDCFLVQKSPFDDTPVLGIILKSAFEYPYIAQSFVDTGADIFTSRPRGLERLIGGAYLVSLNGSLIKNWNDLWSILRQESIEESTLVALQPLPGNPKVEIDFKISDSFKNEISNLSLKPLLNPSIFEPLWITRKTSNPLEAIKMGIEETISLIYMTYLTIDRLVGGTMGVDQLHGPVGVVHLGSRLTSRGVAFMLFFLGIISVNLAVINFLPLPIVDGGLFVYLIYEDFK